MTFLDCVVISPLSLSLSLSLQSFGGLDKVEVDPANHTSLVFTFRNNLSANKVCMCK